MTTSAAYDLKQIREEMGFSYGTMAMVLGIKKATYQGYEIGRRSVPKQIMNEAEAALSRNREFWRGLPDRIDAALNGQPVPNDFFLS